MKFLSYILFIDKIWGEKVSANNWLLPLSILAAALSGVVFGGGMIFQYVSNTTLIGVGGSLIMIWGYNLCRVDNRIENSACSIRSLGIDTRNDSRSFRIELRRIGRRTDNNNIVTVGTPNISRCIQRADRRKREKFILDNGDEVTKNDGLLGDGNYYSTTGSGKVYSSSDERTFREE